MNDKKDIKPIFDWAIAHGDAKIVARVIMKLLPLFINHNLKLTSDSVSQSKKIEVSSDLYKLVKEMSEKMVGSSYSRN